MTPRIVPVDLDHMSEADLASWHRCRVAVSRADHPDDPPPTFAEVVAARWPVESDERRVWFALDDAGDVVGTVELDLFGGTNAHLASGEVVVHPDARRRGVGRVLADTALRAVPESGRNTVITGTTDRAGPVAFATTMGFDRVQATVRGLLCLADIDAQDIARLAAGTGAKADGFSLLRWTGHCPDDLVDAHAGAREGMNDAPVGELDLRPRRWTAARVREVERARIRRREPVFSLAVREDATGSVAGFTEVIAWPGNPRANQDDTTVLPAYRGRGFGLWLKAAMIEWLRAERPDITEYQTGNAVENAHMIAVNERLGYRQLDIWSVWQWEV